jgi:hypothetical protein
MSGRFWRHAPTVIWLLAVGFALGTLIALR